MSDSLLLTAARELEYAAERLAWYAAVTGKATAENPSSDTLRWRKLAQKLREQDRVTK